MADLYPDTDTEEEWRVIWFPADKPDQIFQGDERAVRRRAASDNVKEWNPIVEKRTVTVSPWEPVTD